MNDHVIIITAPASEMRNAHTDPPDIGTKVLALGRGGKLAEEVWSRRSIEFFDAWAPYPQIPDDVKALQLGRFPLAGESND